MRRKFFFVVVLSATRAGVGLKVQEKRASGILQGIISQSGLADSMPNMQLLAKLMQEDGGALWETVKTLMADPSHAMDKLQLDFGETVEVVKAAQVLKELADDEALMNFLKSPNPLSALWCISDKKMLENLMKLFEELRIIMANVGAEQFSRYVNAARGIEENPSMWDKIGSYFAPEKPKPRKWGLMNGLWNLAMGKPIVEERKPSVYDWWGNKIVDPADEKPENAIERMAHESAKVMEGLKANLSDVEKTGLMEQAATLAQQAAALLHTGNVEDKKEEGAIEKLAHHAAALLEPRKPSRYDWWGNKIEDKKEETPLEKAAHLYEAATKDENVISKAGHLMGAATEAIPDVLPALAEVAKLAKRNQIMRIVHDLQGWDVDIIYTDE